MSLQKKYNFIPEHQLNSDDNDETGYSVNISKANMLYFSGFVAKIYGLDGKIIRMYADKEKKSIAWTEIKEGDLSILKNIRKLKVDTANNNIQIGIGKMLKHIGISIDKLPLKNIPVTQYKDTLVQGVFNVIDLSDYNKKHE